MTEVIFESDVPVSKEFGDVYFSKEGGMEETVYVFWEGNDISKKLKASGKSSFSIGELGFGTGLNYFVSLELWRKEKNPPSLFFYTLEKHPLEEKTLKTMQTHFPELITWETSILQSYLNYMARKPIPQDPWEWIVPHPSGTSTFTLKLYLGDVSEVLKIWDVSIDSWYLDGFAPSKNPQMWSEEILSAVAEKSKQGSSFSTFTAAGFVRRSLQNLGFSVEKRKGFGKKREMLVGRFTRTN